MAVPDDLIAYPFRQPDDPPGEDDPNKDTHADYLTKERQLALRAQVLGRTNLGHGLTYRMWLVGLLGQGVIASAPANLSPRETAGRTLAAVEEHLRELARQEAEEGRA